MRGGRCGGTPNVRGRFLVVLSGRVTRSRPIGPRLRRTLTLRLGTAPDTLDPVRRLQRFERTRVGIFLY